MTPGISVILPSFNEGAHLFDNLARTSAVLAPLRPELVVVDDGSSDATFAEAARAQAAGLPVVLVRQIANRGKGAALESGFRHATSDRIAFLDADLEIKPEYLVDFLRVMEETGCDVVVGSRTGAPHGLPLVRRALSVAYRRLVGLLFGLSLRETQAGIKLFRREVLEVCLLHVTATRFAFDVELLALCERFGFRLMAHPVVPEYRPRGRVTMGPRVVLATLAETLVVWLRSSSLVWLGPGKGPRGWMAALVVGLLLVGAGSGLLLAALTTLEMRGRTVPAALLAVGVLIAALALVQLNKTLVRAFARAERLGVWRRPSRLRDEA